MELGAMGAPLVLGTTARPQAASCCYVWRSLREKDMCMTVN
jgi:hypothetical protein